MNPDGSQIRPFLEGPFFFPQTYFFQPAWSPDGQKVAVVVCAYAFDNCYPDSSVELVNANGTGRTFVTTAGGFAKPTWSPDGRILAFTAAACRTCASSVRYVRVDGSYEDVIVNNGHSASWRR
jgi:Tol biopolymer transport system component